MELQGPRFFFNAATAKKSKRLRFSSFIREYGLVTDPAAVAEHAANYFEQVFEHADADMSFLKDLALRKGIWVLVSAVLR